MEGYKDIAGYEGLYSINRNGDVYSHVSHRHLSQYKSTGGYLRVKMSKDGKHQHKAVHVLLAETYIDKPDTEERLTVDHINRVRTDNRIDNLRWATNEMQVQNQDDAKKRERCEKASDVWSRTVEMRDKNDHSILIGEFKSAFRASIELCGTPKLNSAIHRCAKGRKKSAYGYWWKYK